LDLSARSRPQSGGRRVSPQDRNDLSRKRAGRPRCGAFHRTACMVTSSSSPRRSDTWTR
jgi:hypothetical protein